MRFIKAEKLNNRTWHKTGMSGDFWGGSGYKNAPASNGLAKIQVVMI